MNDPSMIGFLGLPVSDISGAEADAPNDHEIRYSPYQERLFQDKEGAF